VDYKQAHAYIKGLIRRGIKYELSKVTRLMEHLGNPHRQLRWVHITGTNGKGSTAASLEGVLRGLGSSVGLFTSPHLVCMRERFRVDGVDITESEFAATVSAIAPAIDSMSCEAGGPPTFFEICFAIACRFFLDRGVDVAVAEVGLGGRLDATNIISPDVCVLTNVSIDHPKTLGPTEQDICREKCGIVKSGVPLICGVEQANLREQIALVCKERSAPLHWFETDAVGAVELSPTKGTSFRVRLGDETFAAQTPLIGEHQALNAALALHIARLLDAKSFCPAHAVGGLELTRWDGRFQLSSREPITIFDGAHNPEGARVLEKTLRCVFPDTKVQLVCGFSGDKTFSAMLETLSPHIDGIFVTKSENYRAADPEDVVRLVGRSISPSVPVRSVDVPGRALQEAREAAGVDGLVLVTGSLYLVGNLLAYEQSVRAAGVNGR